MTMTHEWRIQRCIEALRHFTHTRNIFRCIEVSRGSIRLLFLPGLYQVLQTASWGKGHGSSLQSRSCMKRGIFESGQPGITDFHKLPCLTVCEGEDVTRRCESSVLEYGGLRAQPRIVQYACGSKPRVWG